MSRLGEQQRRFMELLPRLIDYIHENGYECTLGDGYRDPRVFGMLGVQKGYGHKDSNHKRRLAIDINLFRDGEYLDKSSDHKPIGDYWKSLDASCRWGGDFKNSPDGNHYSMEWRGQA